MSWIGDTHYQISHAQDAVLLRRLPDGELQALGIRGRPGFAAAAAAPGLLYRVQWLDVASPEQARDAGAARFPAAYPPRTDGDCLQLMGPPLDGGGPHAWCYRPRERDGGTLSVLTVEPQRRRARVLHLPFRRPAAPGSAPRLEAAA